MIITNNNQSHAIERDLPAGSRYSVSAGRALSQDIFREMHRFNRFNTKNRGERDQASGWRLDKTGRQWLTQQTIWTLLNWLHTPSPSLSEYNDLAFCRKVKSDLGVSSDLKIRYVRMLLTALTGDRTTMKRLRPGLENKDLVHRILTLDMFSLCYKADLHAIIAGIGSLAADGSMAEPPDEGIRPVMEQEFSTLLKWLNSTADKGNPSRWNTDHVIRLWLIGLTVRALREKTGISQLIPLTEA